MPPGEPDLDLVVCTFDTTESRKGAADKYWGWVPVLHAGVSSDRIGCVGVDGNYPMPCEGGDSDNVVCTHLLGLPILSATAIVAAQCIRYLDRLEFTTGPVFVNSMGVMASVRRDRVS
jgi:hypothetical protein